MGKIFKLKDAITLIWETVKITEEQGETGCPYVFIVGSGISAPEILTASGIIQHCKEQILGRYKENDDDLNAICKEAEKYMVNTTKYYSYWFGQAYKNKIHRQQYLKNIINNARISTSNLLLAQILNSGKIATTVITPNFDNHLVKSLNLLGNYDVFSANNILDNIALSKNSKTLQIMHVHGTYEFYDCCNLESEIIKIANGQGIKSTAGTIEEFLKSQSPIVIGYSGWEDDVIMSKLKERLQYAALPYSLLWFCFTAKDYEMLPGWLKDSDDVIFVLPELKKDAEGEINEKEDLPVLPAEDILNALITKFGFDAPNLFSNPIQYYIDLIDGFLPENIEIFPINAWKRRLDYIEEHLGDIEKQIISLDAAAARKDIRDITQIMKTIDYSFIPTDDMEHIVNGVILPLMNSKNRIEEIKELQEFLNEVLDLLLVRSKDIINDKLIVYLHKIIRFFDEYFYKMPSDNRFEICDKILTICKMDECFEEIALITLGMKSDISDGAQKVELLNQIIQRGKGKIENYKIARCVLIALSKQIEVQKSISEYQKKLMNCIKIKHEEDKRLLECYYEKVVELLVANIDIGTSIDDIITSIIKYELSSQLILHALKVQCTLEEDIENKVEIAVKAVARIDIDSISACWECRDYASLLSVIILNKVQLNQTVPQNYVDCALKLCHKEEGCKYIFQIIIDSLYIYISSIDSQYEKRELCKEIINICDKAKLYRDWSYFCQLYIEQLEEKEKALYIGKNKKFQVYIEANQKVSKAVELYVEHKKDECKNLLFEASEEYDAIFDGQYNPALLNICFMARRNEIPELNISVLDVLNKIDCENIDAIYNINRALINVSQGDWGPAKEEIGRIEIGLEGAVQWWSQEDVVGRYEKTLVLLLLLLDDRLNGDIEEVKTNEFWTYCSENITMPEEIRIEFNIIKSKCIQ